MIEKRARKIEKALKAMQGKNPFEFDMYKTSLQVLHISMPTLRQAVKEELFSGVESADERQLCRYLWENSDIIEVRLAVLMRIKDSVVSDQALWKELKWLACGLENWAESDLLSNMLAAVYERDQSAKVEKQLQQWNQSKNPWLRRQSVVSLFYYQRMRKAYPSFALVEQQIMPLLEDAHWYVQKGVGWTLRESVQVYPEQTLQLVEAHLGILSPIAWTTVMEKVPTQIKQSLQQQRKALRAKKPRSGSKQ